MVIAYVLVNTLPGKELEVNSALSAIDGVVEVYTLFGEYDIIAKLEKKDYSEIEETVIRKIRTIHGILETKTLTGIKF
ncbi:MAG: Lrp/AsnC ligand binding domain-containing protein [Candidatus Thermoplasmatota archaeon]|nr:Lrp/AsnC ligand binding domain-containing protein [Candidatus Thermoplasmatota archaeon]MCL5799990.1 Lrp/AsnC ligand binding domain-containing protein [Candidatus Thermoplasmatota archaeon]